MLNRKPAKRSSPQRRTRSISPTPTDLMYEARRDPEARHEYEAHHQYETQSNFETGRLAEARTNLEDLEVRGRPLKRQGVETSGDREEDATDGMPSESDDEFYVMAVHSTFSDCSEAGRFGRRGDFSTKSTRSRCPKRSFSGMLGLDASGARFRSSLARLGRYTKDVVVPRVKGVFTDNAKMESTRDLNNDTRPGYSRLVSGIVSMFYSRNQSEQGTGDLDDADADAKRPDSRQASYKRRALRSRRQANGSPARSGSELSSDEADERSEMREEQVPPPPGVNNHRRSLTSTMDQWECSPQTTPRPPPFYDQETYFEIPDTPREGRPRSQQKEGVAYAGIFGGVERATRVFKAITLLLVVAVVYQFQLVALAMTLVEMFVPPAVLVGLTAASTFVAGFLAVENWRKHAHA